LGCVAILPALQRLGIAKCTIFFGNTPRGQTSRPIFMCNGSKTTRNHQMVCIFRSEILKLTFNPLTPITKRQILSQVWTFFRPKTA